MKRQLPFVIIGAVLIVAVGFGIALFRRSQQPAPPQNSPNPSHTNQPVKLSGPPVSGAESPPVRGGQNAAVTVEEFGDFQCPPCGTLYPELKQVKAAYGDRIRVVFRHFPLTRIHPHAFDAARAAEAAGKQGKFWEMHDLLYQNQATWSTSPDARAMFAQYARSLGLDMERFARDMVSSEANARVGADLKRGESMGVTGTPTVFVNGRQLVFEETTRAGISRAIDAALQGKDR